MEGWLRVEELRSGLDLLDAVGSGLQKERRNPDCACGPKETQISLLLGRWNYSLFAVMGGSGTVLHATAGIYVALNLASGLGVNHGPRRWNSHRGYVPCQAPIQPSNLLATNFSGSVSKRFFLTIFQCSPLRVVV